jgi:outer membrane protein assembly factor BamB
VVDNLLIVGDQDLFALDIRDGSIVWRAAPQGAIDIGRLRPVTWNELVFAGSSNGYVFAVEISTGQVRWSRQLGLSSQYGVFTSPVVDGTLYVTTVDFDIASNGEPQGGVAAIDALTGEVVWNREIPHHVDPTGPTATISPVVASSVVVAGSRDGPLYAFDRATGAVRWKHAPLPTHATNPAAIRDIHWLASCSGKVYFGTSSSTLVAAVDPETGSELWRTAPSTASAEPVWCDNEVVIVMRPLGGIEVLDAATGSKRWELRFPQFDFFYGSLSDGELLYVGGLEGVYALYRD